MMKTEKILEYPVFSGSLEELIEELAEIVEGSGEEGPWSRASGPRVSARSGREEEEGLPGSPRYDKPGAVGNEEDPPSSGFVWRLRRDKSKVGVPRVVVCANPHSLEVARRDEKFSRALLAADIVIPDGVGIILASRILGGTIRQRITGYDLFAGLSERLPGSPRFDKPGVVGNEEGRKVEESKSPKEGSQGEESRRENIREERYRYFFLGSTQENLAGIKKKMAVDYPWIEVCGTYSPPFRSEFDESDNRRMVAAVNEADPHVLWVGLTAPKQEKWIAANRDRLRVPLIGAIGAVFDFYTGNVRRSHPIFLKSGLEWLPRLLREPRRLWYRNFVSNPRFVVRILMNRLKSKSR